VQSTRYSCHIFMKLEFSRQVLETYSNISFHEILPVEAEWFHVDGRTDVTELIVALRNFAKAPKNYLVTHRG